MQFVRSSSSDRDRASSAESARARRGDRLERQLERSPRMQAQRRVIQAAFGPGAAVAQRDPRKTAANILTLGIRKLVVYLHRRAQQGGPAAVPQQPAQADARSPQEQEVERFAQAYDKARWYHQSRPGNLAAIEEHGLLNHADRPRVLGRQVHGMSSLSPEYRGDEKKGVFLGPRELMAESKMTANVARAFMPSSRTRIGHWSEENETPSHEMFLDEKFRGGAVITKDSIPAEQVTTRTMLELLDSDAAKLDDILDAVRTQYGADETDLPEVDQMKGLLRQAILTRRLSDAAFDNL